MDALSQRIDRTWVIGIGGFIAGLVLGLLYAWLLNPVKWIDGEPEQLRADLRQDYLRMAIDSYSVNNDENLAISRYQNLGEFASDTISEVGLNPQSISPEALQNFRATVEIFEAEMPDQSSSGQSTGGGGGFLDTILGIVPWVCGIFAFLGLAGLGVFLVRRRITTEGEPYPETDYEEEMEYEPAELDIRMAQSFGSTDEPIATFRTTYSLGDDLYDDSFSIESATGEFLGECGVGIGDIIGVGEPKKVSAFEVWLFDKNDIQTVTKVLMSEYAHSDDATRSRIATKGDPILAESGSVIELGTESLRLEARIVDLTYGEGALPSGSFFERIAIELRAWSTSF